MNERQLKAARIYEDRWMQLVREGYFIKRINEGNAISWIRLLHMNGNAVTVFFDKNDCTIYQRTNGRLVWQYH